MFTVVVYFTILSEMEFEITDVTLTLAAYKLSSELSAMSVSET